MKSDLLILGIGIITIIIAFINMMSFFETLSKDEDNYLVNNPIFKIGFHPVMIPIYAISIGFIHYYLTSNKKKEYRKKSELVE
jgi:amino acid transporter